LMAGCLPLSTLFPYTTLFRSADEQDVGRVDLQEVLVGVLAPALRRHAGHGAFDELEQGLLHALTRDVARDRGVVRLARDLVDLRSEEHTSELQSRENLVCSLL